MSPRTASRSGCRNQVDLVALGVEQTGQLDRLLVTVVDASQHHVLDESHTAASFVVAVAGSQQLSDRVAVVDGHDLAAQRVIWCVQRQGEADRSGLLSQSVNSRYPANG